MIAQFFKTLPSSELHSLALLPRVTVLRCEEDFGFTWTLSQTEQQALRAAQDALLQRALTAVNAESGPTLLVLDEAISACTYHYLDPAPLLQYLKALPEQVEAVLTGRNPGPELLELADYVTEMKKVRHPFDRGIAARRGIED